MRTPWLCVKGSVEAPSIKLPDVVIVTVPLPRFCRSAYHPLTKVAGVPDPAAGNVTAMLPLLPNVISLPRSLSRIVYDTPLCWLVKAAVALVQTFDDPQKYLFDPAGASMAKYSSPILHDAGITARAPCL